MVEKNKQQESSRDKKADQEETPDIKKKSFKKVIILLAGIASFGIIVSFAYAMFVNYSTEIPETQVPNIIGLDEDDALTILESQNLEGYLVGKRFSEEVSANQILESRPESGTRVKVGRQVQYVLSRGKEVVYLQDIKGLDIEQASIVLGEKLFVLEKVGDTFSSEYKEGIIISQDPVAGEYYAEGRSVKVLVSGGFPVSINVEQIEPGYDRLLVKIDLKVLESLIIKKVNIKIVSIRQEGSQLLYNEEVKAGKELFFELEDEIGARIEVYYNDVLAKARKVLF